MARFTRRGFITRTAAGLGLVAAGAGMAGATKALSDFASAHQDAPESSDAVRENWPNGPSLPGPMLVHVRNFETAEIGLLVGTQEIIFHDQQLVARLVRAADQKSAVEG